MFEKKKTKKTRTLHKHCNIRVCITKVKTGWSVDIEDFQCVFFFFFFFCNKNEIINKQKNFKLMYLKKIEQHTVAFNLQKIDH